MEGWIKKVPATPNLDHVRMYTIFKTLCTDQVSASWSFMDSSYSCSNLRVECWDWKDALTPCTLQGELFKFLLLTQVIYSSLVECSTLLLSEFKRDTRNWFSITGQTIMKKTCKGHSDKVCVSLSSHTPVHTHASYVCHDLGTPVRKNAASWTRSPTHQQLLWAVLGLGFYLDTDPACFMPWKPVIVKTGATEY